MTDLNETFVPRWNLEELKEMKEFEGIVTNVQIREAMSQSGYKYIGLFIDGVCNSRTFTIMYRNMHYEQLLKPALEEMGISATSDEELASALVGNKYKFVLRYTSFDRSYPRHVPTLDGTKVKRKRKKKEQVEE